MGITHSVQAVQESSTAEDRLRLLIDTVPTLVWTALPDGSLDFINQRGLEYHGLSLEGARGWGWTAVVHPEDLTRFVHEWRAALARGTTFEAETRLRRADGGYRWFLSRGVPLCDELGNIVKWYGTTTDIEDRKRAEDALRHGEDLLRLVIDTTPALIHTGRPDGSLDFFNQRWLDYLGASLDEMCGWRWTNSIHPEDVGGLVEKWRTAVRTGGPLEAEARVRRSDGEYRCFLHRKVPLRDKLGNIVKWYGTSTEIEDLKRAQDALQRSEGYLAHGQLLAHTGSWALDPAGFFGYWSQELFRIYGLDPASGAPSLAEYLACIHPQDRDFMAAMLQDMVAKALGCDITKRIVRPDGKIRYIRCVGAPVLDNRILKSIVGTAMDVTEQEEMTQQLQRREAYLTEAQRLSHTGSFGWKPDTGEIVWSDETYRIFEFDKRVKLTMESLVQRVHPEDRADFKKIIDGASAGATQFEHTYRLLMPDGRVNHVHALAHVLKDASGNREFVGAATDVTERKRAEEALRTSEAYLAEAQRLSQTGSWAWSAATGAPSYWSEECYRVMGFDPAEPLPLLETVFQRILPDDRASIREQFERAIRDKGDFELELRFVHPIMGIRNIRSTGHAVLDRCGDLREIVGTVIDVTERKQAEEERRRSEMELRQMLDLAPQHVSVFGPGRERLYANRMALDYMGIGLDEWRHRSPGAHIRDSSLDTTIHPDDSERVNACWDRALGSGSGYDVELRLRKHDGTYRWFLARYNPLRDEQGQITRWYVACTDIEDRKRAEERLLQENVALREEVDKASMFEEIVGASPALRSVLSNVAKVAPTESTVLITGETGTGKELIARAIHKRSPRSSGPFVSVNCAAIPQNLIASELFGHEKGAFTGALQRRLGRFELAEGGTIFVDEVGDLPAETQVALLRVVQEREFERVGGSQAIRADVRVIAATNRDLNAAIATGAFRSDLFYRLNVFPLEIPPLRERREDIPMLVNYFIDRYARRTGRKIKDITKKTLQLLQSYSWPGNIRELQNVIERSVIVCETETLTVDESWISSESSQSRQFNQPLAKKPLVEEKERIESALAKARGKVWGPSGAAAELGIPPSTLDSKIRTLKIDKYRFKRS